MKTKITELLGIEYPIIQGGMAWVADYHLAAAVSEAGGLGIIGAGGAPASFVREQIQKTKELTKKPFGVNVMLMNPEADGIARLINHYHITQQEAAERLGILLVIHMDPVAVNDEKLLHYRSLTEEAAQELAPGISLHDFRLVRGERQINLIFDVVVPFAYQGAELKQLKEDISERVSLLDTRYQCVMTMEKGYVAQG